jgi:speckle-type POZ protein
VFTTKADATGPGASTAGSYSFIKKTELEASPYMRDDSIVIECDVTVVTNKRPRLDQGNQATMDFELEVPPSDLSDNLGKLLEEKKGSDVTFEVGGEVFPAHRAVLAMRSPVFDAELFGPMEEKTSQLITVQDMNPDVFRALLHFIYTDSMPDMEGFDDDDSKEMIKHLIIAADRYAMGRLKRICEGILCKSLDAQNVATIHALADQHHCSNLKNACIEFIASSEIDKVVSSQEYVDLKKSSPTLLVHMLENVTRRLQ